MEVMAELNTEFFDDSAPAVGPGGLVNLSRVSRDLSKGQSTKDENFSVNLKCKKNDLRRLDFVVGELENGTVVEVLDEATNKEGQRRAHIAWGDGYSLAHERTAKQLADAAAAGGVALTGLRHPVDRVVAQYFQTADLEKRTFLELGDWVATHSRAPPRRGHDGRTKLWIELDNAQTKILGGPRPTPARPRRTARTAPGTWPRAGARPRASRRRKSPSRGRASCATGRNTSNSRGTATARGAAPRARRARTSPSSTRRWPAST